MCDGPGDQMRTDNMILGPNANDDPALRVLGSPRSGKPFTFHLSRLSLNLSNYLYLRNIIIRE